MSRESIDLNRFIDHTLLKATASKSDIETLCQEAIEYDFRSVCVPPVYVSLASRLLVSSNVDVCTVIGFPLGYHSKKAKISEIQQAFQDGAIEMDIVAPIYALKSGNIDLFREEIVDLTLLVHRNMGIVKWIVETAYLNEEELVMVCEECIHSNADFIKTSTGFAPKGAELKDVKMWKKQIDGKELKIKASGGIKNSKDAISFINAGASRIGCSASIQIMKEFNHA